MNAGVRSSGGSWTDWSSLTGSRYSRNGPRSAAETQNGAPPSTGRLPARSEGRPCWPNAPLPYSSPGPGSSCRSRRPLRRFRQLSLIQRVAPEHQSTLVLSSQDKPCHGQPNADRPGQSLLRQDPLQQGLLVQDPLRQSLLRRDPLQQGLLRQRRSSGGRRQRFASSASNLGCCSTQSSTTSCCVRSSSVRSASLGAMACQPRSRCSDPPGWTGFWCANLIFEGIRRLALVGPTLVDRERARSPLTHVPVSDLGLPRPGGRRRGRRPKSCRELP